MKNFKAKNLKNRGYAILFTVVIISVILTIALGMSNVAYKELVLSSVARDSQTAFYQADTASECALYADLVVGLQSINDAGVSWRCGKDINADDVRLNLLPPEDSSYSYLLQPSNVSNSKLPCFDIYFDKTHQITPSNVIDAKGYNSCDKTNPKTVERAIEVLYDTQ